jgi:hypothetical protein
MSNDQSLIEGSDEGVVSDLIESNTEPSEEPNLPAPVETGASGIFHAPRQRQRRQANPDDPYLRRPRQGRYGPLPGPDYLGAPGRVAIVQGQVYIVGLILVAQLFLVTVALYQLLSGQQQTLWAIMGISFAGFIIALVVTLWPRQRSQGY